MVSSVTEGMHAGEHLLSEAAGFLSRETVTFKSGLTAVPGLVVAVSPASRKVSTSFSGTGGGAITMDATTPVDGTAQLGDWLVKNIGFASAGGNFQIIRPDGSVHGQVAVGNTFDGEIKFSIADGAPDFALGDTFTVSVAMGTTNLGGLLNLQVEALTTDGTNGSQVAVGVSFDHVDASAAAKKGVIHARNCEVFDGALTWPTGITAAQKAVAIEQMAKRGVIVR